jgi:hypothetical protein
MLPFPEFLNSDYAKITPDFMQSVARELKRLRNITCGPGLQCYQTSAGVQLWLMGRVDGTTETQVRVYDDAPDGNFWPGYKQDYDVITDEFSDGDPCWLRCPNPGVSLAKDEVYLCTTLGQRPSDNLDIMLAVSNKRVVHVQCDQISGFQQTSNYGFTAGEETNYMWNVTNGGGGAP